MSNTEWKILGPGGGGALYHPTISPHDPDVVMMSCDMTCSFMTRDGGRRWSEVNFRGFATAFAHDPKAPGVMYAGASGLYRTEDGGRLWRLLFPAPSAIVSRTFEGDHAGEVVRSSDGWPGGQVVAVAVDPEDSDVLYIGVRNRKGAVALFRSLDRGGSWASYGTLSGDRHGVLRIVCLGGGSILVASACEIARFDCAAGGKETLPMPGRQILDLTAGRDRATGKLVFFTATGGGWTDGMYRSGLYVSRDGCKSWRELAGGLEWNLPQGEARFISRVATCAADAAIVYAVVKEPSGQPGVPGSFGLMKSEDCGESWRWAMEITERQPANRTIGWVEKDYHAYWGGAPFWIGVAPNDGNICYATDWGTIYKTLDGGATWRQLYTNEQPDGSFANRGANVTTVYELAFDPFDRQHILLPCTDIGLFASRDGGTGWLHAQAGVPEHWNNTCYTALFDPDVQGRIWTVWSDCHDLPRQKMITPNRLDKYHGGVCKSEDGARSWSLSNRGMAENSLVTHLIIDPASQPGKRVLYAAAFGHGVYKSADDGATWALKNNGMEGNLYAWRLCLLPTGRLLLLVAGGTAGGVAVDGAMYCSDDGAESWRRLPLPAGVFFANDVDYDPRDPERLYLGCWGSEHGFPERCGGLYLSQDGGQSWQALMDTSMHVHGITVDQEAPDVLYAATYEGRVLRSRDCGGTWQDVEGIDFKWPKKVQVDPYDRGRLYVSTFGSCIWHGPAQGGTREYGNVRID